MTFSESLINVRNALSAASDALSAIEARIPADAPADEPHRVAAVRCRADLGSAESAVKDALDTAAGCS